FYRSVTSRVSSCPCFSDYSPPTSISSLSLHDALPILNIKRSRSSAMSLTSKSGCSVVVFISEAYDSAFSAKLTRRRIRSTALLRSEEHTSELQSRGHLVCRLLLEKKNT